MPGYIELNEECVQDVCPQNWFNCYSFKIWKAKHVYRQMI